MDYTSIHIYGHLLSDDILHEIETESSMQGNREQDFNLDVSLTAKIDNAWSSLRNDWKLFSERNSLRDPYGTKAVRRLMERFFSSLDYQLDYQPTQIEVGERKFDIPYICPELDQMPIIIVGDKTGDAELDLLDNVHSTSESKVNAAKSHLKLLCLTISIIPNMYMALSLMVKFYALFVTPDN